MNQSNHDFSNAMPLNNEQKMVALLEEISATLKALLALSKPATPYADLLASRGPETTAPKATKDNLRGRKN
jgi:hypothetical protein